MLFKHGGFKQLHREQTNPPGRPLSKTERGPAGQAEGMGGEVILASLLLFIFTLHPSSLSAQLITNQEHLTVTSFNDNWGGALSEIHDDQRSFGLMADFQFEAFKKVMQTRLTYSGLTNRFAYPDTGRLDEIELFLRFPVYQMRTVTLNALGGLYAVGDLGGQNFQNNVHSSVGVEEIILPYNSKNRLFGFAGASVWVIEPIAETVDKNQLNVEVQGTYTWSPNYVNTAFLSGGFSFTNTYTDKIALNLGYQNAQAHINDGTRKAVTATENGLQLNYAARLGIANFGITVYPGNNFSSGFFGITLLTGTTRKPIKKIDAASEFGALTNDNGLYIRYLLNRQSANSKHFQVDFHYQFWTIGQDKLSTYPQQFGSYRQFSVGGNYNFAAPKNNFQLIPYLSARAGYKNESIYAGKSPSASNNVWSLNAIAEAGGRIKLPATLLHNNCYYGLTLNYQYVFTFYQSQPTQPTNTYNFAQNQGYFGLGGFVMIDF